MAPLRRSDPVISVHTPPLLGSTAQLKERIHTLETAVATQNASTAAWRPRMQPRRRVCRPPRPPHRSGGAVLVSGSVSMVLGTFLGVSLAATTAAPSLEMWADWMFHLIHPIRSGRLDLVLEVSTDTSRKSPPQTSAALG